MSFKENMCDMVICVQKFFLFIYFSLLKGGEHGAALTAFVLVALHEAKVRFYNLD